MDRKWKTGLIGGLAVTLALAGCVEDKPSVVMLGSVVGSGSIEVTEEVDDDGESVGQAEERVSCEFPLEFDEPNVADFGRVNLTELALAGQPRVEGSYAGATRNQFYFRAVFENRLNDSRTVGAVSGGDGGGFENLELDKNDILIRSASVAFPQEDNTYVSLEGEEVPFYDGFALEYERLTNMLVQSSGGVATLGVPLIQNETERGFLEDYIADIDGDSHIFVAEVQLFGETLGGTPVESNRIYYPIDMCAVDWIDSGMLEWSRGDWQDWFSDPDEAGWDMSVWEEFFGGQLDDVDPGQREAWVQDQVSGWGNSQWDVWMEDQGGYLGTTSWRDWTDEAAKDWLIARSVNECGNTQGMCTMN